MHKIKIDGITPELKDYIRSKGGVISIGKFYQVQG